MTHEQAIAAQDVVRPLRFVDTEQQSHVPVPLARISTCGLITVEVLQEVVSVDPPRGRYRVLTPQQIRGRGAVPALMLLKLLVSRPHRFATKDWLATHLQDEMDMGALVRLDTIASYLRKMLCGMEGFDDVRVLLVAYLRNGRGSGPGYQLAESPFVWLDSDALRFQVEHAALMERMGEPDNALPFWERAVALGSRGTYLADDPFSEWAEDQRGVVVGLVRQSVQSLYRLCMKKEDEASHAHALLLLRTYWQAHKTDEDALRPLLEHLGKHERYQEAEEYYQQCVAALDEWESGRLPDPRTQDMREFLHTKQFVREPRRPDIHRDFVIPQITLPPSSEALVSEIASLDCAMWFGLKQAQLFATMNACAKHSTHDEIQTIIEQEIKMMDEIFPHHEIQESQSISRRQALISIAAFPTTFFAWNYVSAPHIMAEEFLPQCSASVIACWHLLKGKGLTSVNEILPKYVPFLTTIALQPSKHQQRAARIVAQTSILRAILAMHRLAVTEREGHCNDALRYSKIAEDTKLQAAAFMYLGYTFSFCSQPRQPKKAIPLFLAGLDVLGNDNSLIRSDILMGLSEAYAQCKDEQNALSYLELTKTHFPSHPEYDPSYMYAECGLTTLYQWEGKTYLELAEHFPNKGYQQKASAALLQSIGTHSFSERCTNETIIYQADAARILGELEIYSSTLRQAVNMAREIKSKKRYDEVVQVYEKTPQKWLTEPLIQGLARDIFKYLPRTSA